MDRPVLDHPQISRALFHPRRDHAAFPPGVFLVDVKVAPNITVGGRLYPASSQAPAILYFHGNGEIAADYDGIAPLYTQLGITLLVIDYRGYGQSGGTPTASNLLTDAVTAFDAANDLFEQKELSPSRRYVMGRSLGSAAAIEVALQAGEQLSGLIIESGFADTFALLARLGIRITGVDETQHGFKNSAKLSQVSTPTLVIHGEEDFLIPAADGRKLFDHSGAAEKQLVLIPGAGHNDLMLVGMAQYFGAIRDFVIG